MPLHDPSYSSRDFDPLSTEFEPFLPAPSGASGKGDLELINAASRKLAGIGSKVRPWRLRREVWRLLNVIASGRDRDLTQAKQQIAPAAKPRRHYYAGIAGSEDFLD